MFKEAASIEELEAELADRESRIALLRAEQVVLVQRAEWAQATQSDGSRSMEEWVQARLDVRSDVARDLVLASRRIARHPRISRRLADGQISFDRAIATLRYAEAGATPDQVEESFDRDLAGLSRLKARQRRMTTGDERSLFTDRYFVVQPSLDESTYRMWGQLPGVMGRTVEKAITQRSDELRLIGDSTGISSTRGQRQADALVSMAEDSLDVDRESDTESSGAGSSCGRVTVFVDASGTNAAETGAEIMYGPRVGPNTLEAMLCGGAAVNVVGLDDGVPVVTSRASRAIPPAIRQRVAQRDGGCTIDGCTSRYRLQPHHIIRVADGGTNDIDVLVPPSRRYPRIRVSHRSRFASPPQAPLALSHREPWATTTESRSRLMGRDHVPTAPPHPLRPHFPSNQITKPPSTGGRRP